MRSQKVTGSYVHQKSKVTGSYVQQKPSDLNGPWLLCPPEAMRTVLSGHGTSTGTATLREQTWTVLARARPVTIVLKLDRLL